VFYAKQKKQKNVKTLNKQRCLQSYSDRLYNC